LQSASMSQNYSRSQSDSQVLNPLERDEVQCRVLHARVCVERGGDVEEDPASDGDTGGARAMGMAQTT